VIQGVQNIVRRIDPQLVSNIKVANDVGISLQQVQAYLEQRLVIKFLKGIQESGERAASIVKNLLQFSRKVTQDASDISVVDIIEHAIQLMLTAYNVKEYVDFKTVKIVRSYPDKMIWVHCIMSDIEQVILNILKNSAQAMYKITRAPELHIQVQWLDGQAVITIQDNGIGVDLTKIQNIFKASLGGVGLSVAWSLVVDKYKGQLSMESIPQMGTQLTIRLPGKV
jgi:signal transduction histidine kinase